MALPLTLERSKEISDFCQTVLSVDKNIVFAGAINKNVRALESRLRDDGILKKIERKEFEMMFMQCALRASMMGDFDTKLGKSKFSLVERDSTAELVFPSHLGIILVIVRPKVFFGKLAKKISEMVNEFDLWSEAKKLR